MTKTVGTRSPTRGDGSNFHTYSLLTLWTVARKKDGFFTPKHYMSRGN